MGTNSRNGVKAGGVLCLLAFLWSGATGVSQTSGAQMGSGKGATPGVSSSALTLRTFTRMVNLELVVKDSKGHHIEGLKAGDFRIFEQTPSKSRDKREQKIANFKEVHVGDLPAPPSLKEPSQPGVYTNTLAIQKDPTPPTILLVDGLNTDVQSQAQVHVQMLRMLRQLPSNVPVAVFLLGDKLAMLQSFTTDPKLLQAALSNVTSPAGVGIARTDPRDDPNAAGNLMEGLGTQADNDPTFKQMIETAREFDQRLYADTMDERVYRTTDALISLGHHVAGYPGRKNLLWLSTTFPLLLSPIGNNVPEVIDEWAGYRNYQTQLQYLNTVLSDAKVAVYPVNVAGVQTLNTYQAGTRPPDVSPIGISGANTRQIQQMGGEQDTMDVIATGTGGIVCTGDNDLGDCVRKAADDSSDFYEIAYYPDSPDWNGEFRKIMLKTNLRGAHLSYRQGYYATPEGTPGSKDESIKLQSDCEDYIDSTAIQFSAKSLPPDAQGALRFALTIDAAPVTFALAPDGGHVMHLAVAACTYNEKGWTLKLMSFPADRKLDAKQFQILANTGRLSDMISVPGPRPAAVRLLVKDVPTGRLGSIYIKTADAVAAARTD
jgi:VWFA-related protein